MKATANALIPVETANASTHLSVDLLRRKPYRSARPARLTTRTCPQSRPRGDYHRSTPMTLEHQPCSAPLMQPVRPTVHHPPSPQASLCPPHFLSSTYLFPSQPRQQEGHPLIPLAGILAMARPAMEFPQHTSI